MKPNKQVTINHDLNLWETYWEDNWGTQYTSWTHDREGRILHSRNDQPAVIEFNPYCDDSNFQAWYHNGLKHRGNDKPAFVGADGTKEWHQYGNLYREYGKPTTIESNGTQRWQVGSTESALLHRTDGPAVVRLDGTEEYWVAGIKVDSLDLIK